MGDLPKITDYITPAPPYMPGGDRLSAAISDIWKKRQLDEANRINAAQQVANQAHDERSDLLGVNALTENRRHSMADEGHQAAMLGNTQRQQTMEYLGHVITAYNSGNETEGDALAAQAHLFGLAPAAMAAVVAQARQGAGGAGGAGDAGVPVQGDPHAATRGPEPGMIMGAPIPNSGSPTPGGQPMTPPLTQEQVDLDSIPPADTMSFSDAEVDEYRYKAWEKYPKSGGYAPPGVPPEVFEIPGMEITPAPKGGSPAQAAGQAPASPQADLNAPQPAAPPQPAGDPQAPPPAQVQPPAPAPADQGVRRDDIHIQPQAPSQLGMYQPEPAAAPGPRGYGAPNISAQQQEAIMAQEATPPQLPATPWQNDISQHPTVREADPRGEGQAPTTFPGAPSAQFAGPGAASPAAGPSGGAPGAVDAATQRRWVQRGVAPANTAVMPDGEKIMSGNERRVRAALEPMLDHITDPEERSIIEAAIELGVAGTRTTTPEKAVKDAKEWALRRMDGVQRRKRAETMAEAQSGRLDRNEGRHRADRYIAQFERGIGSNSIRADVDGYKQLQYVQTLIGKAGQVSSGEWETAKGLWLGVMKNKGASTDKDAERSEGGASLSLWDKFTSLLEKYTQGPSPLLLNQMRQTGAKLEKAIMNRTHGDYMTYKGLLDSAPNDDAWEGGMDALQFNYAPFGWAPLQFKLDHRGVRSASKRP